MFARDRSLLVNKEQRNFFFFFFFFFIFFFFCFVFLDEEALHQVGKTWRGNVRNRLEGWKKEKKKFVVSFVRFFF